MQLPLGPFAMLALPACVAAPATAASVPITLPAPEGLSACAPGSPGAQLVSGMAEKLGGEFQGCFVSNKTFTPPEASGAGPMPLENAFAISLPGQSCTRADIDRMLAKVKDQWKDFDPLDAKFKDAYIAKLNAILAQGKEPSAIAVDSIKPVLISIDRPDDAYYVVTSLRTYNIDVAGGHMTFTKINSSAVALRNASLIRLTIQRTLRDPADVAHVQDDMANWVRAALQN